MKKLGTLTPATLCRFMLDESGATSIEYAMIAAGIAGVIIAVVYSLGGSVTALYDTVAGAYTG